MNDDFNEKLFITVQKYIIETKRFSETLYMSVTV